MKRNEALEVATRELTKRGIPYEVVRSKKHWQVRWMIFAHRPRRVVVVNDPGERRALLNTRADVRRLLRQDGIS
jgi:hypothetical protein